MDILISKNGVQSKRKKKKKKKMVEPFNSMRMGKKWARLEKIKKKLGKKQGFNLSLGRYLKPSLTPSILAHCRHCLEFLITNYTSNFLLGLGSIFKLNNALSIKELEVKYLRWDWETHKLPSYILSLVKSGYPHITMEI